MPTSVPKDTKKLAFLIETSVSKAIRDMNQFERSLGRVRKKSLSLRVLKTVFSPLGAAISGGLALNAVRKAADTYTDITSKVRLYAKSESEANQIRRELFRVSNETNTSVAATAQLYSRLSLSQKELGASNSQIIKFTELVGKSLAVSGTDAVSAQGAIIQLSQAMGEGIVRAQEFNSILENAPYLLQVVARQLLGASGTVAGLRRKMKDGELSSKDFFNALLAGSGEVDASFSKVGVTTGKALTKLKNTFIKFIGAIEERLGVVGILTKGIEKLAGAFNFLVNPNSKKIEDVLKIKKDILYIDGEIKKIGDSQNRDDRKRLVSLKNAKQENKKLLETKKEEAEKRLEALTGMKKEADLLSEIASLRKKVIDVEKGIIDNPQGNQGSELGAIEGEQRSFEQQLEEAEKQLEQIQGLKSITQEIEKALTPSSLSPSQQAGVSSSGNSGGNVAPKIDTEAIEREAEELKKIQELIRSSLAYPETDLEKNKRTLQAFIDEYKDKGEQFKQVVEDAYFAIGEIDIDINEQKLKKQAEKVQSTAEKVADNIKNIFSVISDGFSTLFSNQLLELERFYEQQTALLEQETEEEELYKELKAEREAEEFQEKFGIKQEQFYQLNQADQEAYIKSLDEKEKAEELANLSAVKSREKRDQEIAKLEKEKAAKEKAIRSEQFRVEKGNKIAQAIMNAAIAITRVWAESGVIGFPLALALSAKIGALTGAQIGIIKEQKNPYAYREGGIAITPQLAALAEAGQPELVLNAELTKHIRDSFATRNDALDPTPSVVNNTINIQSNDPIAVAEELNDRLGINL